MPIIRTTISVDGFIAEEVAASIEDLREEFAARPWLLKSDVGWDAERGRLLIIIESEGGVGGVFDEVSDCVVACIHFAGERISFNVDEAVIIDPNQ